MSASRRPDKGHNQTSRLLAPSAGRLPQRAAQPDVNPLGGGDARLKIAAPPSAPVPRIGNQLAQSGASMIPSPGGHHHHHHHNNHDPGSTTVDEGSPYDSTSVVSSSNGVCPQADVTSLAHDIIAGLTSTGNYVSLKYDGQSKSRVLVNQDDVGRNMATRQETKSVVDEHIQVYTNWANHYLAKTNGHSRLITNLQTDLTDGVLLARLIESVVGEKISMVPDRAAQSSPEALANVEACFEFLVHRGVNVDAIRPKDIRAGSLRNILGLLFNLSHHKQQTRSQRSPSSGCSSPQVMTSRSHLQQPIATTISPTSTRIPSPPRSKSANLDTSFERHHVSSEVQHSRQPTYCNGNDNINSTNALEMRSSSKANSALPRSSRQPQSVNVSLIVPDTGGHNSPSPTNLAPSTPARSKSKSPSSMLEKLKLFGMKNRSDKDKNGDSTCGSTSPGVQQNTANNSQLAMTSSHVTAPGDSRVPRLPVRNNRDAGAMQHQAAAAAAVAASMSDAGCVQPHQNGVDGINYMMSSSAKNSSVSSVSSSSSGGPPKAASKMPSRSLPRSQNSSVRSGRRSVEPAACSTITNVPRTPEEPARPSSAVPGSRTSSITSLATSTDAARPGDNRKLSSSVGNRIPAPTSMTKMKAKSSRDGLVAAAGAGRPPSSKDQSCVKTGSSAIGLPKSRCQSAPRVSATATPPTVVIADGNQSTSVSAKSQVATVRQLPVVAGDVSCDRSPSSAASSNEVARRVSTAGADDITIPSDVGGRKQVVSKMPRFASSSAGRLPSSRQSGATTTATEPSRPAQHVASSSPSSSAAPTNTEMGKSPTPACTASTDKKPDENTLTRTAASSLVDDVEDNATSIKPMKPMTSLSYLFTSTPQGGVSTSSSTQSPRLLSASRRPFPSVSVAPTVGRATGALCSGYVSDGDMSVGNRYHRYSGYLSESGTSTYANRRAQQSFLESIDGMRQCLERGLADVDDDDLDDVDDSDDDVDCCSVTSAEIDVAISAADDELTSSCSTGVTNTKTSGAVSSTPAAAASDGRRHVAFSPLQPFERSSVTRATLPTFSSGGGGEFHHKVGDAIVAPTSSIINRPSTGNLQNAAMTTRQRLIGDMSRRLPQPTSAEDRPRSKSVGRAPIVRTEPTSCDVSSGVPVGMVASSTPSGRDRLGSLASDDASSVSGDGMRTERFNGYRRNGLLKYGCSGTSSAVSSVQATPPAGSLPYSSGYATDSIAYGGRWSRATGSPAASGRRSVDSVTQKSWDWAPTITSTSTTIRDGGQEDLVEGEIAHHDGQAMIVSGMARCRTGITGGGGNYFQRRPGGNLPSSGSPYSNINGDPTVVAGVSRNPRMHPSGRRTAMSDVEGTDSRPPSYRFSGPYSSNCGLGERSLPRNGFSWTSGDPMTSAIGAEHLTPPGMKMVAGALSPSGRRPSHGQLNGMTSHLSSSHENLLHGSTLSLGSNSSSLYSTAEEIQAQEIYKLRRELDAAQNKIASLNSHLNTNAHVVFAFEQSLGNMTQRLQRLAASTDQKDAELNEMRTIINSLRLQRGMTSEMLLRPSDLNGIQECGIPPAGVLRRHLSSDSVMSAGQQSLSTVSSEGDRKKKKHKNWLLKAFSRKKKNDLVSDADSDTSSIYADSSLTPVLPARLSHVPTLPVKNSATNVSLSIGPQNDAAVVALQEQLHEKDMRMTDIQLEALSSAHHLQQLKDTISRMKNEMVSLRVDNERLQQLVQSKSISSTSPTPSGDIFPVDCERSLVTSSMESPGVDIHDGTTCPTSLQNITLSIRLSSKNEQVNDILISKLTIDAKSNWESLIGVIGKHFRDYMHQLDPGTSLGLDEDSIHCYTIAGVTFGKDLPKPDMHPCGYFNGETANVCVTLKGPQQKAVDSLAYDTLVPKSIVQRYVSLLMEHRRIILCGSSGTGKTYMAHRLAEHLIQRAGKSVNDSDIVTFCVDHKTGRELRQYLSSIADKCDRQLTDLPHVIILDGLHHVTSPLGDTFNGFLNVDYQSSPYIIGTMNQNQASGSTTNLQLHHNFRWVLCANHMEPVQGFLGRYLRRRMAESSVRDGVECKQLDLIVQWIQLMWQQLNRLLETHNSTDVTIGPRLFLSCPMDAAAVPTWFTDLWNYSIVPYLLEAVREGIQTYGSRAVWEDPVDWVRTACPWSGTTSFDWSSLQRIRPEDIGSEGLAASNVMTSSGAGRSVMATRSGDAVDPLMNMLLKLQEAANVSSGSDLTSDSQELDGINVN